MARNTSSVVKNAHAIIRKKPRVPPNKERMYTFTCNYLPIYLHKYSWSTIELISKCALGENMTEKDDWTKEELIEEVNSHTAITIPVDIHIEGQQKILDFSEMELLLKDAKLIALGECYCRKKIQKCDAPIEVCLNLDKEAEDFINKGLAKKNQSEKSTQSPEALSRSRTRSYRLHFQRKRET
jgi:hypothetical protein